MSHKLLPEDARHYPLDNPAGFYSTVDIVRILDITMERLQDWIKRGFVVPLYDIKKTPTSQRGKKYFVWSQVYKIGLFRSLTDLGIKRDLAEVWANAFHNIVVREKKGIPDFAIFNVDDTGSVKQVSATYGYVHFNPEDDFDSIHIVNMKKIIEKINAYKK